MYEGEILACAKLIEERRKIMTTIEYMEQEYKKDLNQKVNIGVRPGYESYYFYCALPVSVILNGLRQEVSAINDRLHGFHGVKTIG